MCLDTKAVMRDKVGDFFARLADRLEEVKRRCRTVRQARAEELAGGAPNRFSPHRKCISHLGFSLGNGPPTGGPS